MKKMTIGQRMNRTMALLVLLLLVGVVLVLWAERIRTNSAARADDLNRAKDRIYFDMVQMSDSFRGLLLLPRSERDTRSSAESRKDLAATFSRGFPCQSTWAPPITTKCVSLSFSMWQ